MSERFCPTCEDYRAFNSEVRSETYAIRGREVVVPATVDVCTDCGETLFDEARDEELLRRAYDEYRRLEGLLTPDEIVRMRKGYRLSQRSLAILLGMSEATINRYENGAVQDQAHDNVLRACLKTTFIRELLDRRGGGLTNLQRRRVERALAGEPADTPDMLADVDLIKATSMPDEASLRTGFRRFDYRRYAAVVSWFCRNLVNAVTQTKLCKLLFYADFLNFKTSAVSLTGAAYRKRQYGPVPADGGLRDRLEYDDFVTIEEVEYQNGRTGEEYRLGPRADEIADQFTAAELAVLECVAGKFRDVTPSGISELSHREPAWQKTEDKKLISYEHAAQLSLSLDE